MVWKSTDVWGTILGLNLKALHRSSVSRFQTPLPRLLLVRAGQRALLFSCVAYSTWVSFDSCYTCRGLTLEMVTPPQSHSSLLKWSHVQCNAVAEPLSCDCNPEQLQPSHYEDSRAHSVCPPCVLAAVQCHHDGNESSQPPHPRHITAGCKNETQCAA